MYRIHRAVHWASLDAYIRSLGPAGWWLKGQGQTVTGSGVSQWDDLSGNGRHLLQGTDAARPALQADGSVLFNGTSHYLKCNAFTLNQPTWVVMAVKQVSWTDGERMTDGNTIDTGLIQQQGVSPNIRIYAGTALTGITSLAIGAYGVLSAILNGANSSIQHNLGSPVTGNAGSANMGGFTLGAKADGVGPSNIQVAEVALFPIAPSAAQQDRLVAGLMARHGVA